MDDIKNIWKLVKLKLDEKFWKLFLMILLDENFISDVYSQIEKEVPFDKYVSFDDNITNVKWWFILSVEKKDDNCLSSAT